jgi:plastocyanin
MTMEILRRSAAAFFFLILLCAGGCGGGAAGSLGMPSTNGKLTMSFALPDRSNTTAQGLIPSTTRTISLSITGEGLTDPYTKDYTLPAAGGSVSDSIELPTGSKSITVEALDSGGRTVAHRISSLVIRANEVTNLEVKLGVSFTDSGFVPSSMIVSAGDELLWVNNSSSNVSFRIDGEDANIAPGGQFSHSFSNQGTFPYSASNFSGSIVVASSGGGGTAGAFITGLTPMSGGIGDPVSITGSGFGAVSGNVTFGASPAITTTWSDGSISCTVPAGLSPGNVSVIITPMGGSASDSVQFTVTGGAIAPPPAIEIINPDNVPAGSPVTISGSGFGAATGTVTFGGSAAAVSTWNDTTIQCTVPVGLSPGPHNVVVTALGGASSTPHTFTVSF